MSAWHAELKIWGDVVWVREAGRQNGKTSDLWAPECPSAPADHSPLQTDIRSSVMRPRRHS